MNETCTHFTAVCPGCLHGLKVHQKYSGQWVRCRRCDQKFQAPTFAPPSPSDSTATEVSPAPPLENGSRLSTTCPACAASLSVRAKYAGRHIRCGQCGHKFQVGGKASTPQSDDSSAPHDSAALARLADATAYLASKHKRLRERQHELRRAFRQLHAEFERLADRELDTVDVSAFDELRRLHLKLKADLDLLRRRLEDDPKAEDREIQAAEDRKRRDELAAAVADLTQRIESDDRGDRLVAELGELKQGRDEAEARIAELQAQILALEEGVRTAEGAHREALAADRDGLSIAIEEIKAQLLNLKAGDGAQSAEQAIAGLASRYEATAAAVDELKAQIQTARNAELDDATAQTLAGLAGRHDALSRAIDDLAARIQGVETDARPAQAQQALAAMVERHEATAAAVEAIRSQLLAVEAEARTPRDGQAIAGLEQRHNELAAAIERLQTRLQGIESDASPARRDEEISELRSRNDSLAGRHDELSAAISELDDRIGEIADNDRTERIAADLSQRHNELFRAVETLREDAGARAAQASAGVEEAQRRHDLLAARSDELATAIEALKRQVEGDDRADRLGRDLGELKQGRDEAAARIAELQVRLQSVAAEAEAARRNLDAAGLAQRHEALSATIDALHARLQTVEAGAGSAAVAELSPTLAELRREIELLKQRSEERAGVAAATEGIDPDRIERLHGRQDEMAAAIEELKTQIKPATDGKELTALRTLVDETRREIEFLKVRLNRAESITTRTMPEFTTQKQRNDQFARQHGETAGAIEELKAALQAAREDLESLKKQEQSREVRVPVSPAFKDPGLASISGPAKFAFHGRARNFDR